MVILLLVSVPISFIITLNDVVAVKILLSGDQFLSAFAKPQLDALATVFLGLRPWKSSPSRYFGVFGFSPLGFSCLSRVSFLAF